ncbi:hypothetical protein CC78DRAFT_583817 [Lojkania enalia]|uniref:Uncharacterized protein n=1 Tax=Lojkania enalia TaxID=147567 RepID=A0A9P4K5G2_9PLEO|nr:hypothetical protein CC78DRAFT_583817 [Didymosphaeria enalia]
MSAKFSYLPTIKPTPITPPPPTYTANPEVAQPHSPSGPVYTQDGLNLPPYYTSYPQQGPSQLHPSAQTEISKRRRLRPRHVLICWCIWVFFTLCVMIAIVVTVVVLMEKKSKDRKKEFDNFRLRL